MKLILVEDDPLQAERMMRGLRAEFETEIELISNEAEFCERLDDFGDHPPDLFILDVILTWTEPGPTIVKPPQDVVEGGRDRAGFRCRQRLAERRGTRRLPVILYSFLDRAHFPEEVEELPPSAVYLRKEADLKPLFDEIRRLLPGQWSEG